MTQSWTLFQWRQRTKEEQTETFDSLSLSSSRDVLGIKTKIRHGGARRHEDGKKFLKSKRGEKATEMDCFIHGNRFLLHFPFFVSFPSVRFFKCPDRLTSSSTGKECPFLPFVFFRFEKNKSFFLSIWANLLQGIIRNAVNGVVCFAVKGGRETPSPGWPALQHMAPKLPLSRPPSLFFTHTPVAAAAAAEETFKTVRYVSLKMAVIKATAADCTLLCHSKENWEKKMTTAAGGEMPSRWAASGHTKATPWQQPVERFRLALGSQSIPT